MPRSDNACEDASQIADLAYFLLPVASAMHTLGMTNAGAMEERLSEIIRLSREIPRHVAREAHREFHATRDEASRMVTAALEASLLTPEPDHD